MKRINIKSGKTIYSIGDIAKIYFVEHGDVDVFYKNNLVEEVWSGGILGADALFSRGGVYYDTAIAKTDVIALKFEHRETHEFINYLATEISRDPSVLDSYLQDIAERVEWLYTAIDEGIDTASRELHSHRQ